MIGRRRFLIYGAALIGIATAYIVFSRPKQAEEGERELTVNTIATGLETPWSISFISNDEAILTERRGRVNYVDIGSGRIEEITRINAAAVGEGGLLGVATKKIGRNQLVFLYYTYRGDDGNLWNRVERYVFNGGLEREMTIVDGIEGAAIHDGGRIRIGPDNRLYITTGDAARKELSQDLNSLAGKILRVELDGSVPGDNPFRSSPIFSYGNRNPQGIDWHPITRLLYSTEHGPSGENGWFAHDEVNLIKPGGNYGWPVVIGAPGDPRFIDPILHSGSETWAPAGCSFHSGRAVEEWRNNLLFGALRGQHLHRVVIGDDPEKVIYHEKLFVEKFGRLRDVVEGPDGVIYVLTSNRDGRGVPREGDDKILGVQTRY